jgi:dipeptidyl aminopeptidase/acylaminoacyl peptidase
MIPAMGTSTTLGEAISATLRMNSITLEPAWQSYLREQAGLLPTELPAPAGELAMWCAPNATDQVGSSIWRIRADGTGLARITAEGQIVGLPSWSPNGKRLAYTQGDFLSAHVLVMDVDSQQVTTMADELKGVHLVGWLPDGRLEVAEKNWVHLMNIVSGEDDQFSDREQFWSPDGKWIVYHTARSPQPSIWIADSNGRSAHKIAPGYEPVWSPDSKRLWRSRGHRDRAGSCTRERFESQTSMAASQLSPKARPCSNR